MRAMARQAGQCVLLDRIFEFIISSSLDFSAVNELDHESSVANSTICSIIRARGAAHKTAAITSGLFAFIARRLQILVRLRKSPDCRQRKKAPSKYRW